MKNPKNQADFEPEKEPSEELKLEENTHDHYDRSEKSESVDDYVQAESLDEVDHYEHVDEESDDISHYDKDPIMKDTDQVENSEDN